LAAQGCSNDCARFLPSQTKRSKFKLRHYLRSTTDALSRADRNLCLLALLSDAASNQHRGSVSDFIDKWAGAFSLPDSAGDDPCLAYLLGKHAT
jgi:hypothetical protein